MKYFKIFLLFLLGTTFCNAQVGINTSTPDASSVLDVQFKAGNPKGMLTPRMTTSQRGQIASPANGLLVFDTDLKTFYYFDSSSTTWTQLNGNANGRSNFKLIKSTDNLAAVLASELSAGGGSKYVLNTNTLYEINGAVTLNFPIDLNNAYLQGLDSGEDKIISAGNIFDGSTGGTVKGLTIVSSGKVFNLSGAQTQNLIFRDCIIANSASVGSISGFGLIFFSIVQFSGNTTGITYSNINQLLLSNLGWFGNNLGTYTTLIGTFKLVEKQGGFSEVDGTAVGIDVSSNPTITDDAVMESVVFTGTNTVGYIKPYTIGTYTGYNFNNSWNVRCSGISVESNTTAVGDINFNYAVGSGSSTTLGTQSPTKLVGTTTSNNLFRFSRGGTDNRLQYLGTQKRFFRVSGSASFQSGTGAAVYILYVAKNGIVINQSKVYVSSAVNSSDVLAVPIQTIIEMTTNDYIEVWADRYSGVGNILTVSLNLIAS